MYTVYKIIFPNNKCYIGITKNLYNRKASHKNRIKNNDCKYPLYNAFRKYGFNSVTWVIMDEFLILSEAENLEKELIKTETPNYNVASGGMVHEISDDMKRKIGIANSGKRRTEESKNKCRMAALARCANSKKSTVKENKRKHPKQKRYFRKFRFLVMLKLVYKSNKKMSYKELSKISNVSHETLRQMNRSWEDFILEEGF